MISQKIQSHFTLHQRPVKCGTDTFSCLSHRNDKTQGLMRKNIAPISSLKLKSFNGNNTDADVFYSLLDDPELAECFLTLPMEKCYLNVLSTDASESPSNI